MRVTPNYFIIMFVEFLHMKKKDFPRVTLVFEDGKWVGANKMTLAASSYLCAAAWQKKASAPTDLYEGNSEQYFGGIPPPGIMLNARNFSATYYTSREVCPWTAGIIYANNGQPKYESLPSWGSDSVCFIVMLVVFSGVDLTV